MDIRSCPLAIPASGDCNHRVLICLLPSFGFVGRRSAVGRSVPALNDGVESVVELTPLNRPQEEHLIADSRPLVELNILVFPRVHASDGYSIYTHCQYR